MSWNLLRRAVTLSRQSQHSEALELAAQLLGTSPQDPRMFYQVALIQLEGEQPELALETLAQSEKQQPDSPVLHLYRAMAQGQLEHWELAWHSAEQLQRVCPANQFLATLLCWLHLGAHRIEQALEVEQIERPVHWVQWFRPELAPFPPLLSRLLLQVERYLLPLEVPILQGDTAPDDPTEIEVEPVRWTMEGLSRSIRGYLAQREGVKYWEKSFHHSPQRRHEYLRKAIVAQRRAVELEPHQFRGHYYLGEALLFGSAAPPSFRANRDELEEAQRCLIHSWAREGGHPYLFYYLGRCSQMLGKPLAARTYLEKALEKFVKFPEAHYALGQVELLMGNAVLARNWLKRSVSSDFLPVVRDRLQELASAFRDGRLEQRPAMPDWPPVQPTTDSDPTTLAADPVESGSTSSEEKPESHQSEDPQLPPENRDRSPDEPDPADSDSLSSPPAPPRQTTDPVH